LGPTRTAEAMRPAFLPDGVGFRCEFCGGLFPDVAALHQHLLSAHTGRPFTGACETCGMRFASPQELRGHRRSAHGLPV
jgi:hypothetical protein